MIITLDEAKLHLRVDSDIEDTEIEIIIEAAEEMIKNVTGTTFNNTNSLAKVACLYIITDLYESRGLTQSTSEKTKDIINMILTQLSLSYGE